MLRAVGSIGVVIGGVSLVMVLAVVFKKFVYDVPIAGWTSLLATLLLIGGLLLCGMGVAGEYLIRIIESSENKPPFFVCRRAGFLPGETGRARAFQGSTYGRNRP